MRWRSLWMGVALGLVSAAVRSTDVAVLTNGNFEECRKAAKAAAEAVQPIAGGAPAILELSGSGADQQVLEKLRAQNPRVVLAMGVYAAKMARKTLPGAWIVYTLVLYPEVEDFPADPKMVGVACLGSEKKLLTVANALAPVKVQRLAVLHSVVLDPAIQPMLVRLGAAGFQATDYPLSEAPLMEDVMRDVTGRFQAVLLLPDPLTENPSRLRYMITTCVEKGVFTLTTDLGLVYQGVLCGTYVLPARAGRETGVIASQILSTGRPPSQRFVTLPESESAVNVTVAKLLRLTMGIEPDLKVQ